MIRDDVNRRGGAVQIVSPDAEGFEDGVEFLVMYIIVEFGRVEGTGVECDGMNLTILKLYRKYSR